jgi:hypothetical protein
MNPIAGYAVLLVLQPQKVVVGQFAVRPCAFLGFAALSAHRLIVRIVRVEKKFGKRGPNDAFKAFAPVAQPLDLLSLLP